MNQEEFARQWVAERHPRSPGYDTEGTGFVLSAVDWRGIRFHVGEQVMYCVSAGRSQMMAIGEVKQIKVDKSERRFARPPREDDPEDKIKYEYNNSTKTYDKNKPFVWDALEFDDITVQVLTSKTSGRWDNKARTRPAWVNPMNITAMDCPYDCGPCHSHEDELDDDTTDAVETS